MENGESDDKENMKSMRKYLSVPTLKKILKFSRRMRRSALHMIHKSEPDSLFDKSNISEEYSAHSTSLAA